MAESPPVKFSCLASEAATRSKPSHAKPLPRPTMRVPGDISGTDNVYRATRAALVAIYHYSKSAPFPVRTVVFPGVWAFFHTDVSNLLKEVAAYGVQPGMPSAPRRVATKRAKTTSTSPVKKSPGKKAKGTIAKADGPAPADLSPTDGDDAIKRTAGVDKLETSMRRDGPGAWVKPGGFCLLAAPATTPARKVIESLAAFVSAFLDHSKLPQEMVTWTVTLRGWHLVFYFSIPRPQAWIENEHLQEELQDLDRYVMVDYWGPRSEILVEYDGSKLDSFHPGSIPPDMSLPQRYGVTAKRPVPALFKKITGISIAEVEQAIPFGEPWWIIHNCQMLFPIAWDEAD